MQKPQSLIEFLDELVEKSQLNVYEYEEFYEDKLADIRKMNPMDSFLYGVATGKLDVATSMRDLIRDVVDQ